MTEFEREFFKKFNFTEEEIKRFFESVLHDLEIARKDPFPEVRFSYSFQALIKAGIVLLGKTGKVKVRSIPGHHAMILKKMSEILKDTDISAIGDAMRTKRNTGLYGGGAPISEKETDSYLKFVERVIQKVEKVVLRRVV